MPTTTTGPVSLVIRLLRKPSKPFICTTGRYPDSLPEGTPTDHFGRLQSLDALTYARSIVEAIDAAMALS